MTLCMVWRTASDICFASDSRLSFGSSRCDAAIKICRVPYSIYEPNDQNVAAPLVASGDLGLAFAGSAIAALMMKEALSEVVRDLQGIPGHHAMDMDGIADVMRRGFGAVCREIGSAIFERVATAVVFAGYCVTQKRIRVFRMQVDGQLNPSFGEILLQVGDYEVFGSGAQAARAHLAGVETLKQRDFIAALQAVIGDPNIPDVGGAIQYGHFKGCSFQSVGVAMLGDTPQGVHYWRGPLDLNGTDFDQAQGLIPRFPLLDLV